MLSVGSKVKGIRVEKVILECPICLHNEVIVNKGEMTCTSCGYTDFNDAFEDLKVSMTINNEEYMQHYYDYLTNEFSVIDRDGKEFWLKFTENSQVFEVIKDKII